MNPQNKQDFVDEYIESLVTQCLLIPKYANLPADQQQQAKDQLTDRFYNLILDTVVDKLNDDQVAELSALPPQSPEMEAKIEQFSALIPNLMQDMQTALIKEVEVIRVEV